MSETFSPSIRQWLTGPLPADVRTAIDRLSRSDDVARIAVMPDAHLAHEVCVGTVLATRRLIYPDAVGGDIGCGIAAVALDATADVLRNEHAAAKVMAGLYRSVPSNRHPRPRELPPPLRDLPLSEPRRDAIRWRDAAVQFGTLGRGNHFVEFQADEQGQLWLMVHSGSRAVGPAVRERHKKRAAESAVGLVYLEADSTHGQAYLNDAGWAVAYAAANRLAMVEAVTTLVGDLFGIGAVKGSFVDCHHNHVRREAHFGELLWVHRKGAAPAAAGEQGLIPGSMGTRSYHVEGRGCVESLLSSSHGAGRLLSRDAARRRISTRELVREMGDVWFDHRHADQLRDEGPSAYRDIHAVMRAQKELTRIVRTLRPILSYKGTA